MKSIHSSGVALIITLVVIMLLSLALTKSFEERVLETKYIDSGQSHFESETLARSVFRALMQVMVANPPEGGLVAIMLGSKQIPVIPLGGGTITNLEIIPMDHLFSLRNRFKGESPRNQIFTNIIRGLKTRRDASEWNEFELADAYPAISAIKDWIDIDTDLDQDFPYGDGGEFYPSVEPEYEVKNRPLDVISEYRLIPAFQELENSEVELTAAAKRKWELRNFFHTYDNTVKDKLISANEQINVNVVDSDEMLRFLESYQDVEGYPNVYNKREELVRIVKERMRNPNGYKYSTPLVDGRKSNWESDFTDLEALEKALFTYRTRYLRIAYTVKIGSASRRVEAELELKYPSKGVTVQSIDILYFRIH